MILCGRVLIEKADKITVVTHERKKHSTHKDSFENLETEEIIHKTEGRICPECGSETEVIGKEFILDELVYVPARMYVRKHYVETIRCVSCGIDESRDNENNKDIPKQVIVKAAAPAALIPRSFCSPELLAHILYSKYVQAVPLYRQEKDYTACGAKLSRQTMSNWVICAAVNKAKPVFDIMKEKLKPIQECGCTAQTSLPEDTLRFLNILLQETEIMQQSFLEIIRGILSVTDMTATTSLKRSRDADAGRMRGESSLRLYPQTRSLFPHQWLQRVLTLSMSFMRLNAVWMDLHPKKSITGGRSI